VRALDTAGAIATVSWLGEHRHGQSPPLKHWRLALDFEAGILDRLNAKGHQLHRGGTFHLPPSLRSVAAAIRSCHETGELRRMFLTGKCQELVVGLLRPAPGEFVPTSSICPLSRDDTARIASIRRILRDRAHQWPTLDELASEIGVSRSKLVTGFRKLYGVSVGQAMAHERLHAATERLLASGENIGRVAYRSGYESAASFTRAFAARYGVTPAAYRASGGEAPPCAARDCEITTSLS
jgi:AraC family transcriptional regulator, transcriptional activator of the genes for pyochelin and ferripyochelin receptors